MIELQHKNTTIKAYGFIYVTTNKVNGKKYIGKCLFKRDWFSYLGSGKFLKIAIDKYGKDNFQKEIIYIATNKEELENAEKEYINYMKTYKSRDWYNISRESVGGNLRAGYTESELNEWRKKVSDSKKGQISWNKGIPASEETKKKISEANKGNKHTHEAIEKIRASSKGRKMPKSFSENLKKRVGKKNPMFGKKHTEKAKLSMSEKRKGSLNGFSRSVECEFGDGEIKRFDYVGGMVEYFKNEYNLSKKPLDKLISTGEPYKPRLAKHKDLEGLRCRYV